MNSFFPKTNANKKIHSKQMFIDCSFYKMQQKVQKQKKPLHSQGFEQTYTAKLALVKLQCDS